MNGVRNHTLLMVLYYTNGDILNTTHAKQKLVDTYRWEWPRTCSEAPRRRGTRRGGRTEGRGTSFASATTRNRSLQAWSGTARTLWWICFWGIGQGMGRNLDPNWTENWKELEGISQKWTETSAECRSLWDSSGSKCGIELTHTEKVCVRQESCEHETEAKTDGRNPNPYPANNASWSTSPRKRKKQELWDEYYYYYIRAIGYVESPAKEQSRNIVRGACNI